MVVVIIVLQNNFNGGNRQNIECSSGNQVTVNQYPTIRETNGVHLSKKVYGSEQRCGYCRTKGVAVDGGNGRLSGLGRFVQGECYRDGYGVEPNARKGLDSYRIAINSTVGLNGIVEAHYSLGSTYEAGEEVRINLAKAFEHFAFGAHRYDCTAQWKAANYWESESGVERDVVRAVHYFRLAANNGYEEAQIKSATEGKGR